MLISSRGVTHIKVIYNRSWDPCVPKNLLNKFHLKGQWVENKSFLNNIDTHDMGSDSSLFIRTILNNSPVLLVTVFSLWIMFFHVLFTFSKHSSSYFLIRCEQNIIVPLKLSAMWFVMMVFYLLFCVLQYSSIVPFPLWMSPIVPVPVPLYPSPIVGEPHFVPVPLYPSPIVGEPHFVPVPLYPSPIVGEPHFVPVPLYPSPIVGEPHFVPVPLYPSPIVGEPHFVPVPLYPSPIVGEPHFVPVPLYPSPIVGEPHFVPVPLYPSPIVGEPHFVPVPLYPSPIVGEPHFVPVPLYPSPIVGEPHFVPVPLHRFPIVGEPYFVPFPLCPSPIVEELPFCPSPTVSHSHCGWALFCPNPTVSQSHWQHCGWARFCPSPTSQSQKPAPSLFQCTQAQSCRALNQNLFCIQYYTFRILRGVQTLTATWACKQSMLVMSQWGVKMVTLASILGTSALASIFGTSFKHQFGQTRLVQFVQNWHLFVFFKIDVWN